MESIYIQAIQGKHIDFRHIRSDKKTIGCRYGPSGYRLLSLTGIHASENLRDSGCAAEADEIYHKINATVKKHGFSPKNIYRFWNYLSDIQKTYKPFNLARDRFYENNDIQTFPAATGIEAGLAPGKKINISLDAMKPDGKYPVFERISSDIQCEAWQYGPKFSRAALVKYPGERIKKLYISGTSSVNRRGRSILTNDPIKNILYVISCVRHLLKKNRMDLNDIATSFVYFKDEKMYRNFLSIYKKKGWDFPFNPVFVSICRDSFHFEMECVAANNHFRGNGIGSEIINVRSFFVKISQ